MPAPLFRVVYEEHSIPLEGFDFTQAQIIRAQVRKDLGRIVVVERVDGDGQALCINGLWQPLRFSTRTELRKIIARLEHDEREEDGAGD